MISNAHARGQVLSAEAFNCQHIRVQGLPSDLPHTPGAENRRSRSLRPSLAHVWHLGVESLDLSTCRLILRFHLREQPSHWGSATAQARNFVRHVSSICFSLWLTSIKPNRRAWYYGGRNSQDVAIASSHRLATSSLDSVLRTASKSGCRQIGLCRALLNWHVSIFTVA